MEYKRSLFGQTDHPQIITSNGYKPTNTTPVLSDRQTGPRRSTP